MTARIVYLGNLVTVARALAAVPGAALAACVIEREDAEAGEFRVFAKESGSLLYTVHGREELGAALRASAPVDYGAIANFGIILTQAHIASARHGFVNAHLGLLPEYPGRHPIRDAMKKGEPLTGVTLHQVTAEVDGGPVIDRRFVPLSPSAEGADVFERVARVAGDVLASYFKEKIAPPKA